MNLSLKNASLEYENARLLKNLGAAIRERELLREELTKVLTVLNQCKADLFKDSKWYTNCGICDNTFNFGREGALRNNIALCQKCREATFKLGVGEFFDYLEKNKRVVPDFAEL